MLSSLRTQKLLTGAVKLVCALLLGGVTEEVYAEKGNRLLGTVAPTKAPLENITGTVKDSKGEPLPGVNVLIKGTKTGTITDIKGMFRLNLPTGNETLIFSYIGFKTQEVPVGGKNGLTVQLEEDAAALGEVVVVGYGTQKKASLTGAVATVDMKSVQDLPVNNLSAVLAGQLPGVGVTGGTSRPGDNAVITVRNPIILSKDGGTLQPLYVIGCVYRFRI